MVYHRRFLRTAHGKAEIARTVRQLQVKYVPRPAATSTARVTSGSSTPGEVVAVREAGSSTALASSRASASATGVEKRKLVLAAFHLFDLFDGKPLSAAVMGHH